MEAYAFFLFIILTTITKIAKRTRAAAHIITALRTPPIVAQRPAITYEIAAMIATTEA